MDHTVRSLPSDVLLGNNGSAMTEARKGEIAILVLKYLMRKRGLTLSTENREEFVGVARALGIPTQELKNFVEPMAREYFDEFFSRIA